MTKWQESCITALASSPLAWEAFKMKQRNKRMLWQYVNRIWPYKRIKKTRTSTLEYRFLIVNLKYSDYVIQMLALIHITECIKHNCILNKSYLNTLATVAKNLRK